MTSQIYLDNNSTTPIDLEVADRIHEVMRLRLANPSSQHQSGQFARRMLEQARNGCLKLLDADHRSFPADNLIFTSGGTEANNLAIFGFARKGQQLVVSSIEHPSVLGPAESLAQSGIDLKKIPVDQDGVCQLDQLREILAARPTSLVSVMLVNNETGVIQPVQKIAALCRELGIKCHTDAVQAVGKIPVSFRQLGVDLLTFTAHKFHGPRGIGALVTRPGADPKPIFFGGFQQRGIRPGTEDVALAVGCQMAMERAVVELTQRTARWNELRLTMLSKFSALVHGSFLVNGQGAEVSPHTVNVAFPGVERQSLMIAADVAGVALSTGTACSSGSSEPSPVLLAMGLESAIVESSIRISFGKDTTTEEVIRAAELIANIVNEIRSLNQGFLPDATAR